MFALILSTLTVLNTAGSRAPQGEGLARGEDLGRCRAGGPGWGRGRGCRQTRRPRHRGRRAGRAQNHERAGSGRLRAPEEARMQLACGRGVRGAREHLPGREGRACARLEEGEHPCGHSDRGGHYRRPGWIGICDEHGIVRSKSRKGCSPDSQRCEGFFGRCK